jgi:hypothetical protein
MSIGVQSLAMMLTSLLPGIFILAITVVQIWKCEPSVPFLVATTAENSGHEMSLVSKLGTVQPYAINERFSYV